MNSRRKVRIEPTSKLKLIGGIILSKTGYRFPQKFGLLHRQPNSRTKYLHLLYYHVRRLVSRMPTCILCMLAVLNFICNSTCSQGLSPDRCAARQK